MEAVSARDRDHLSMWANYPLLEGNSTYRQKYGVYFDAQRRIAWSLRSIFMAATFSSNADYFQRQLDFNLQQAVAYPKNQFHLLTTTDGYGPGQGVISGYKGMACWMQNYVVDVVHVLAKTQTGWAPIRD